MKNPSSQADKPKSAVRGLVLTFVLAFLNLAGVSLSVAALGGFDGWTEVQFIGFYGVFQAGTGLSYVYLPDIWRLPIAEQGTSRRTPVHLALSTLTSRPAALANSLAGIVMIAVAVYSEGAGPGTLWLLPLALEVAVLSFCASALGARLGVARPDLDVVQVVLRWRGKEQELQPISLTASVMQFLLSILTLPAVKLLPVDLLYSPSLEPSPEFIAGVTAATLVALGLTLLAWRGRMGFQAPREQQKEAEANA